MPFKSKAQQKYMFATNPKVAEEMASKTSKSAFKDMPEHVAPKKGKKGKVSTMLAALRKMGK
jgi:hypothetical protein